MSSNTSLVAFFSGPMNEPLTDAAFTLTGPGGKAVAGSFAWYGPQALIFTPTQGMAAGATYAASVSSAAQDQSGHPLATAKTWSFTTTASG